MRSRQRFGKCISKLVTNEDMNNTQLGRLNQVIKKVIINRKVFHARMKNRISGEICGTKIFREQGGWQPHWGEKF